MGIDLKSTQLFRGIGDSDLKEMLHCLGARERTYRKGETILAEGQETDAVGVVLSGRAIDSGGRRGERSPTRSPVPARLPCTAPSSASRGSRLRPVPRA